MWYHLLPLVILLIPTALIGVLGRFIGVIGMIMLVGQLLNAFQVCVFSYKIGRAQGVDDVRHEPRSGSLILDLVFADFIAPFSIAVFVVSVMVLRSRFAPEIAVEIWVIAGYAAVVVTAIMLLLHWIGRKIGRRTEMLRNIGA